jgi:hypothetical protein
VLLTECNFGVGSEYNRICICEGPLITIYRNLGIFVAQDILNKGRQVEPIGSRFDSVMNVFQILNAAQFSGSAGIIFTNRMTISFS